MGEAKRRKKLDPTWANSERVSYKEESKETRLISKIKRTVPNWLDKLTAAFIREEVVKLTDSQQSELLKLFDDFRAGISQKDQEDPNHWIGDFLEAANPTVDPAVFELFVDYLRLVIAFSECPAKFDSDAIPHNQISDDLIPDDLIPEELIPEELNEPHEVSTTVPSESTAPESERYRVITVNGFFKIASISEIEYQAGYEYYPPDWATRFDFEGSLSECESWLDEYQSEMLPEGRFIILPKSPKSPKKSSKSPRKSSTLR